MPHKITLVFENVHAMLKTCHQICQEQGPLRGRVLIFCHMTELNKYILYYKPLDHALYDERTT